MPSDKDILKEARDFLNRPNYTLISYEARQLLRALADEVERQRAALTKLRDSTRDMWACSFAGEILKGEPVDDALTNAQKYDKD